MTTHQQDSSQPQQSHSSPQPMVVGLGLMMDLMLEVVLPGILEGFGRLGCGVLQRSVSIKPLSQERTRVAYE